MVREKTQTPNADNQEETRTQGAQTENQEKKCEWPSWSRLKHAWKKTRIANKIIAVFIGMTAVGVFVTAILYACQIRVMDGQLDIMERQLSHIEQSSQLEQRAWVGLQTATHEPIEPNKPIEGVLVFENTGKTPAIILRASRTTCLRTPDFDMESLAEIKQKDGWLEDRRSRGPLPPNAVIRLTFQTSDNAMITEPDIEKLENGQLRAYVIGRILYRDIFGTEHETCFCHFANPGTNAMTMGEQFNRMD